MSTDNYNNKVNLTWASQNKDVSEQRLFLEATYNANAIISEIFIRLISSDAKGSFMMNSTNFVQKPYIVELRHRKFGRCYTFYPDKHIRKLGIYYIRLKL